MANRLLRVMPLFVLALPGIVRGQASQSLTIDDFFDGSRLHEIRITMDPADWQKLKDNYLENTNYRCRMEWDGLVVENAAIRSRGSVSRNPDKPGLGIDFSKYVSSQRFLGMKSVVLRNSVQDPSMVHERLSMEVFRRIGLIYLREAHARLYINGAYIGLFVMVEPIDTRFLKSHFGESEGYLYEFNWLGDGYHWEYLGDDPSLYVPERFEPKNHEDAPDGEWIAAMLRAVSLSSDTEFLAAAGRYLDLDTFVAHVAAEEFLAEWDGLMGDTGTTNFYFYRRKADDRGVVLVWDKEATFTAADWTVWRNTDRNAVMKRLLVFPQYRQRFLETLAAAAALTGGEGGWLAQEAEREIAQIRQAALEDPYALCEGGTPGSACQAAEREKAWDNVRQFAAGRRAAVEQLLQEAGFEAPEKSLSAGSVTLFCSNQTRLAPGAMARLAWNADSRQEMDALGYPLPRELDGVTLRIGGITAPLVRTGSDEILFQVPLELPCGSHPVVVTEGQADRNVLMVEVRPSVPVVFFAGHGDGNAIDQDHPARPGERIILHGTGFGLPESGLTSGDPAPFDSVTGLKGQLQAFVGGTAAKVLWAGFTPGFVGCQMVVLEVPSGVGGTVRIEISMNEELGPQYEILVQ